MELLDAIRTNASVREYLADPVDDATLYRILDTARFAPIGGNMQAWHVVVVKDRAVRAGLRDLSQLGLREYVTLTAPGQRPFAADESGRWPGPGDVDLAAARARDYPWPAIDGLVDAPALLIVAVDIRKLAAMDTELDRVGISAGGSIYPFMENILLAARAEGLGGVMTTFVTRQEPAAQQLLGLPASFCVAAMVTLGTPVRQVTRLKRKPVGAFATIDRFDGPRLGG